MPARRLIESLGLLRHPEGGWYRETYRAHETVAATALPGRYGGGRAFSTAIYFLLEAGDFAAFHRIHSDELWHFYAGEGLSIHVISPDGICRELRLGPDPAAGEAFQVTVPAGCWFAAEPRGAFTLAGCTVAPGFDFADFELADRDSLAALYPACRELIGRLTRPPPP